MTKQKTSKMSETTPVQQASGKQKKAGKNSAKTPEEIAQLKAEALARKKNTSATEAKAKPTTTDTTDTTDTTTTTTGTVDVVDKSHMKEFEKTLTSRIGIAKKDGVMYLFLKTPDDYVWDDVLVSLKNVIRDTPENGESIVCLASPDDNKAQIMLSTYIPEEKKYLSPMTNMTDDLETINTSQDGCFCTTTVKTPSDTTAFKFVDILQSRFLAEMKTAGLYPADDDDDNLVEMAQAAEFEW